MVQWADFDFSARMFQDADETLLRTAVAAVENAYSNQAGGHSRFPGLTPFATTGGDRNYLFSSRNQLYAATDAGRLYRIGKNGEVNDVTGTPLSGGKRTIFTETEDGQILMASGGPIITLSGATTEVLSPDAPQSSHVGYIDGYVVAIVNSSQRFQYADPGQPTVWNDLSVFSADGKPDDLTAMAVTPYRELLLAGENSIEQFERLANGTQPFARRWATGEGVGYPYTLIADKSGTYGVNTRYEFVRFYGQISQDQSADVSLVLEKVDNWEEAWAAEISVKGEKLMVLQMPHATNAYGTKGLTLLLDYRARRWSLLYGWDTVLSRPGRWPVWSVARAWGRVYCGVSGGVALLDDAAYQNLGLTSRFLVRSAHVDKFGPSRIDDFKVRLKRGVGAYDQEERPLFGLRVNRDNDGFGQWQREPLGAPGERTMTIHFGSQGAANTWQFEMTCTDDVAVEFVAAQAWVERLEW